MAKSLAKDNLPRTVEEFDRWHAQQPERWEFIAGVPVMMAPASLPHTIIKTNIARHLGNKLAGTPCRAYVDGAEVKVRSKRLSAIPDIVVACGRPDLASPEIREPIVIVEVLSPSTERDDTERKCRAYRLIPSLRYYLVVEQEEPFVTVHTRTGPSAFIEEDHQAGTIDLPEIGVSLSFAEIYEDVEFTPQVPDA